MQIRIENKSSCKVKVAHIQLECRTGLAKLPARRVPGNLNDVYQPTTYRLPPIIHSMYYPNRSIHCTRFTTPEFPILVVAKHKSTFDSRQIDPCVLLHGYQILCLLTLCS